MPVFLKTQALGVTLAYAASDVEMGAAAVISVMCTAMIAFGRETEP
jgi:hypothetical protein